MRLTAAFCTWNRSALLRETLTAFTRLEIPAGIDWELIVVNNNSTDDTESVLGAFRERLPLRALFEPKQGVSHARNAAIAVASGEYMLWTDDDALIDRHWMEAYVAAFRRWPDAVLFGGPIRPRFEGTPPTWLDRSLSKVQIAYAALDFGPEPRPLSNVGFNLPFGANYAVRTDLQRRHRYDTAQGKVGDFLLFGEEIDVMSRIFDETPKGWWVPNAIVHHWIVKERQTLAYIKKYYMGQGRTQVQFRVGDQGPIILGRPRWLWRKLIEAHARYYWRRVWNPPERWIEDFIHIAELRGAFEGYRIPALRDQASDL